MTLVRSHRAGTSSGETPQRPTYAKVLGLRYLRPGSLLCFAYFEGAIALAALLALAELAEWWAVLVLPLSVAAMVKLNDVIAGAVLEAGSERAPRALGRAAVPMTANARFSGAVAAGMASPGAIASMSPPRAIGRASPTAAATGTADTRIGMGIGTADPGGSPADALAPISPAGPDEWVGWAEQRSRQSGMRRYE